MNRRFRHIALLALAAVMTVGCGSASEEDIDLPVPPQPGQETPIAFSGSLSEEGTGNVTRSTGLEEEGVKSFRVWAYKNDASGKQTVMENYIVNWVANTANTTTSNTHDWEYVNQQTGNDPSQTIKYWDWGVTAYRFFGYTGENIAVSKDDNDNEVSVEMLVNGTGTLPYYSRLWYGTPSDDFFGKAVQLVFLQPVAKVRFLFVSADPVNVPIADMNLSDPTFKPTSTSQKIAVRGSVTVTYPLAGDIKENWGVTPGSSETDKIDAFTQDYYETPDGANARYWYTVLPAKNQGSYTLSVKVNSDPEPKTCVVPAEYMNWLPGYQYTYVFKINEEGDVALGEVMSAYTDWIKGKDADYTIYNW